MGKRKNGKRESGTGSIYKDGNGYRVQLLVQQDGRQSKVKKRVKTQAEAVQVLNRLTAENFAGRLSAPSQLTVESYFLAWLEANVKPYRAANTYRQYKWIVQNHILPSLGRVKLNCVTRQDLRNLISRKATEKIMSRKLGGPESEDVLSYNTLRLIRAVLRKALQDAVSDQLVGQNVGHDLKLPKAPQKKAKFLRPEEALELYHASHSCQVGPVIRFFLGTGVRISEALGVRWEDVDFNSNRILICGQLLRVDGQLVRVPETKNNRIRYLTMPAFVATDLQELQSAQQGIGLTDPDGIVFLNADGRRYGHEDVRKKVKACCRKANVTVVPPHGLRHTSATMALMKTSDLHGVQKWLGHQQSSLTANLYGHATNQAMDRVAGAMGEMFGK